MSERRIFLDTAPGEIRGVVTLSGRPERLLLVRDEDSQLEAIGARLAARVADIEPALATAFLDLGKKLPAGLIDSCIKHPTKDGSVGINTD